MRAQYNTGNAGLWLYLVVTLNDSTMFRELDNTAFCILFRTSLDRAPKILLFSTFSFLDHSPKTSMVTFSCTIL